MSLGQQLDYYEYPIGIILQFMLFFNILLIIKKEASVHFCLLSLVLMMDESYFLIVVITAFPIAGTT